MSEDQDVLAEDLSGDSENVENAGIGPGDAEEEGVSADGQEGAPQEEDHTSSIQKRIHAQARKHAREMRQMQEQMHHLQSQLGSDSAVPQHQYNSNPYPSPGQPNPPSMSEEQRIHEAVRFALGAKDHQDAQAKQAEQQAHVHKQYQRMNDEFDKAAEKYDDFDDVVRGEHMPFTPHVRDALLLVQNPADVAYKLGKNKSELERISKLHPLDQAREVNKLSFSLLGGKDGKQSSSQKTTPMGSIRQNPASNSGAITSKTSPSEIRARMKAGTFK